jgi:hypothetical protein
MKTVPTRAAGPPAGAWFHAAGAVTGVGSVPHTDPARAIEFVARAAPEVPFWPQLRRRSPREAMFPQTFGDAIRHLIAVRGEYEFALPTDHVGRFAAALERDGGRLLPANAAGFDPFVGALRAGAFPRARAAKGHAMGPVTLACSMSVGGTPAIEDAEMRALLQDHVVRVACRQAGLLQPHVPTVIVVLDEAYLGMALRSKPERTPLMLDLLRETILRIRRPGVLVGLHCCDQIPFAVLETLAPDVYSFDAWSGGDVMSGDEAAHRFVMTGGRVAWGWIPTLDDLSSFDAGAVVARWENAASRLAARGGVDAERLLATSLVTASCGLAGSSEATCARSFELAAEVSRAFAARIPPAGA